MRKRVTVAAMLLLWLVLAQCGSAAPPRAYREPQALADGWPTALPESVGLDREKIEALVQEVQNGGHDKLHSVLLVKDGKLVLEEYLHRHRSQRTHDVASVTKSVTSILIGIAIQQGAIAGADQPLAALLPEYADLIAADPAKQDLRLWHVLTMTSGFEWDEESYPYGDPRNDCTQMERVPDPVRFVLERPVVHQPGTRFQYAGANSMLLAAIIRSRTGMHAHAYAKQYLFEPLGISGTRWGRYISGLTDTTGGLSLRSRDMAKIGLLYLNGGRWNGAQVVPQSWIEESTRAHVRVDAGTQYGYQWWRTGVPVGLRRVDTYFASGFGGQAINVFPELGLVVVFTNELVPGPGNAMQNVALMSEYVLPAALPPDASHLLPWAWLLLVGLSLLVLLRDLARSRPALVVGWSWAWTVSVFGPLGFVLYRACRRGPGGSGPTWRRALGATLHCASGNAAGFCLLFALVALFRPPVDLLLPALVLPLLAGWLAFRAPVFAHQTGLAYGRALRRTLLTEVTTTLLVLAGTLPAIMLLQTRWFPLGGFDPADPLFSLMISLSATGGAILVCPFNYWMARRGFLVWPGPPLASGEAMKLLPSLRNAWWAVLLSLAVLAASMGLALGALA